MQGLACMPSGACLPSTSQRAPSQVQPGCSVPSLRWSRCSAAKARPRLQQGQLPGACALLGSSLRSRLVLRSLPGSSQPGPQDEGAHGSSHEPAQQPKALGLAALLGNAAKLIGAVAMLCIAALSSPSPRGAMARDARCELGIERACAHNLRRCFTVLAPSVRLGLRFYNLYGSR